MLVVLTCQDSYAFSVLDSIKIDNVFCDLTFALRKKST